MSGTSKRIRVLHITFDMGIGGTEQVIKNLIEGSAQLPIDHHICCIEGPVGPWGITLEKSGIPVFKLQREPKITLKVVKNIRKIIKDNAIDIVHGHQYTPFVYGFLASRFLKSKIIFTEHGRLYPDIVSKKRQLLNRFIFPFVDSVTAISKATKDALVKNEKVTNSDIKVIYNGIEPVAESNASTLDSLRKQYGYSKNTVLFGTVARLDTIKNQLYMIREFAAAYEKNSSIRLLIVGDGPERSNIESLVAELGLRSVVTITGFISKPNDLINLMDVFLLPSLSEGTSMTLLEAMSAGKPSIVSNAGGNPEIISETFLGRVIDNQPNSISEQILNFTEDHLRNENKENTLRWYQSHYSTQVFCKAFSELYSKLITIGAN